MFFDSLGVEPRRFGLELRRFGLGPRRFGSESRCFGMESRGFGLSVVQSPPRGGFPKRTFCFHSLVDETCFLTSSFSP